MYGQNIELDAEDQAVLERQAETLIAMHGGDTAKALRAAILHSVYLEMQIEQIATEVPGLIKITHEPLRPSTR